MLPIVWLAESLMMERLWLRTQMKFLMEKQKNVKSHDFRISYLCYQCHYKVDQANISREEKREIWESGHRASIGWLFNSGRLKIVDPPKYD